MRLMNIFRINRLLKKLLKTGGIVFLVVCLIFISCIVILSTNLGEAYLQSHLTTLLIQLTDKNVDIVSFSTNVVSSAKLSGLTLSSEDSEVPDLIIDEIKLNYNFFALLQKRIKVKSLSINGLSFKVSRDLNGEYSFPFMNQDKSAKDTLKSDSAFPFEIEIDDLNLQAVSLRFQDRTIALETSFHTFSLNSSFQRQGLNHYIIRSDTFGLTYSDVGLTGHSLLLEGQWTPDRLAIDRLSTWVENLLISGDGVVDMKIPETGINGRLTINGEVDSLTRKIDTMIAPVWKPVGGQVDIAASISGTVADPYVNCNFNSRQLSMGSISLNRINAFARISQNEISIDSVLAELFGGKLELRSVISADSQKINDFQLNISGMRVESVHKALFSENETIAGSINGFVRGKGSISMLDQMQLDSKLSVTNIMYKKTTRPDITSTLNLNRGRLAYDLLFDSSFIESDILVRGSQIEGDFEADLRNIDLIADMFNIKNVEGHVETSGALNGKLSDIIMNGEFQGHSIKYNNIPLDSIEGKFNFNNSKLVLDSVEYAGAMSWSDSTDAPFNLPNTSGTLRYRGLAEGTTDNPSVNMILRAFNIAYGEYDFDYSELVVKFSDNTIHIPSLDLLKDSLGIRMAGKYTFAIEKGEADIIFHEVDHDSQMIKNDAMIPYLIHSPNFVAGKRGHIKLEFSDIFSDDIYVRSIGEDIDIELISQILFNHGRLRGRLHYKAENVLNMYDPEVDVRFKIENPVYDYVAFDSLSGEIRIENRMLTLNRINWYVNNNVSQITAGLKLLLDESNQIYIGRDSQFYGSASSSDFNIHVLESFVPDNLSIQGMTSFYFRWNGTVADPNIQGALSLEDAELGLRNEDRLVQDLHIKTSLLDSLIIIESMTGQLNNMPFRSTGKIEKHNDGSLDGDVSLSMFDRGHIKINGTSRADSIEINTIINDLQLDILESIVTDFEYIRGLCNLNLKIKGLIHNPEINGHVALKNMAARYPEYNLLMSDGNAKLEFSRNMIKIDSISMDMNGGEFVSKGRIYLDKNKVQSLNINMKANDIKVDVKDELSLNLKRADLNYVTQNRYHDLTGEIELDESKIVYNFRPKSILPFTRKVEKPASQLPDFLNATRLNLKIRESENVWIDNNLARIRFHPEINIVGFLSAINIRGRVNAIEGYVLYLDRKFDIKRGILDFVDPNRINPNIDIEAVSELKSYHTMNNEEYTITLKISGLLDQARLSLESEPELDRSDILALLTIGVTRQQISARGNANGEATSVSDLIKTRLEMFSSQRISYYASQKMGDLFGLEKMSIEGNLFNFGSSWGPQLVASKKITDRIALTYDTSAGELNDQGIRLDYRLKKNLYLQGRTNQNGRSAIDIKYGIKFK